MATLNLPTEEKAAWTHQKWIGKCIEEQYLMDIFLASGIRLNGVIIENDGAWLMVCRNTSGNVQPYNTMIINRSRIATMQVSP